MEYFLASQVLSFLVFVVGLKMAHDRREHFPELASFGWTVFGILGILWLFRFLQVGWTYFNVQSGAKPGPVGELLKCLGYIQQVAYYGVIAMTIWGSTRWRERGITPQPVVLLLSVSLVIKVCLTFFIRPGHDPVTPWLLIFGHTAAMAGFIAAFYGWRGDNVILPLDNRAVLVKPDTAERATLPPVGPQPVHVAPMGMFEQEDYLPFVIGVMVLGGLIVVPFFWGKYTGLGYGLSLVPSLLSCGIFVYAHDQKGNFSILKFLFGLVFVFLAVARAVAHQGYQGKPMFFAGGILGYIVMLSCGWAGIKSARIFRRSSS